MLFLIRRRYPRLGLVLGLLSSAAFIALGLAEHSTLMIASSVVFTALSLVQVACKRHATPRA